MLLRPITRSLVTCLCAGWTVAHAATIISGNLFFTTFQNQSGTVLPLTPNVFKVAFIYDSVAGLCVGSSTLPCPAGNPATTPIATLTGADGLIFDPNDATLSTLLIGEQNSNRVAQMKTDGTGLIEKKADVSQPFGVGSGQAYGIVATPDKMNLLTAPNDVGFGQFNINVSPLNPLGDGTAHLVSGPIASLRGIAFIGNTAYYGDALDQTTTGHMGTLDISGATFTTTLSTIIDDVDHTAGQGSLPSHGLEFDPFSGCIIISGSNEIWQVCPDPVLTNTLHIKAKVATSSTCSQPTNNIYCSQVNWDQVSVDGAGHLFAANNDGDLMFIDYSHSATKSISDAGNYTKLQFLAVALDDLANGGGAPPATGCPATQGFWHKAANWPNVTASVNIDGVIYNPDHSMVIGGITYTQSQLLSILPSGSLHTGGYVNALSQFIAAVLNLAAGAQHGSIDSTISAINTDLTGVHFIVGTSLGSVPPAVQAALNGFEGTLDNYNSAVGLGCTEGSGLNIR